MYIIANTGNFRGVTAPVNGPDRSVLAYHVGKHVVNRKIDPFPTGRKRFYKIGSNFPARRKA